MSDIESAPAPKAASRPADGAAPAAPAPKAQKKEDASTTRKWRIKPTASEPSYNMPAPAPTGIQRNEPSGVYEDLGDMSTGTLTEQSAHGGASDVGFTDVPTENPDSDEAAEDDDAARVNQVLGEDDGASSSIIPPWMNIDELRKESENAPKKKKKEKGSKKAPSS